MSSLGFTVGVQKNKRAGPACFFATKRIWKDTADWKINRLASMQAEPGVSSGFWIHRTPLYWKFTVYIIIKIKVKELRGMLYSINHYQLYQIWIYFFCLPKYISLRMRFCYLEKFMFNTWTTSYILCLSCDRLRNWNIVKNAFL